MESEYPWPSNVNVANFVTVKELVEGDEDESFSIWQKQMMCLLKSQGVAGFVTGETPPPEKDKAEKQHEAWTRTDCLVKEWILGSIDRDALEVVWEKETARDVWDKLKDRFSRKNDIDIYPNEMKNMRKKSDKHKRAADFVSKLCEEMTKMPEKIVRCMFLHPIIVAAENGIKEIVEKIMEAYPSVAFAVDQNGRHVFQVAAKNRYEQVFNIIYTLSDLKSELFDVPDYKGNNLLHIRGKLAPPHRLNLVSGAAQQMQRELQCFSSWFLGIVMIDFKMNV